MKVTDERQNPDQFVEQAILKRLAEENICDECVIQKLRDRIAAGNLTPEDWHSAMELPIARDGRDEGGAHGD